jgi:class 3 adenylate cyclase/tetratricopeptide (TPR) repeat protein
MDVTERKLATVVFADLVGSTALGGSEDPERTRVLLDRFYEAMADEIERAGGTVEKFAGDAVMAVFGAPAALEDHAERALHAALAMLRRTRDLDDRLELRIGVNTGEVVVGRAREGSSFVTGDPVNVAARLEQGAEPGDILAGERTVSAARGAFEFGEATTIEAKGKAEGVPCRRVVRALSLMRPRGLGSLARAFVGREEDLARLSAAYASAVEERQPRLVTILGDAGVGKTRLVRELWEQLAGIEPEPLRRTGRCLSYGAGIAYWALGEVLREHFGLLENDPPEEVLEALGERQILGVALGLDVAGDLHPLAVRDRFQDAWAEFLTDAAAERPVVLLVEDIHWAEDQLLDLLEHVLSSGGGPLLLVATARPELVERRPGWGTRANGERLALEPLSQEDSVLMLGALLSGALPQDLGELVVERAEGNPFFVEELLGMLIDRGMLRRDNGGWTLDDLPPDFAVPDSVHAVLAARIDLLEPAEKAALQAAAVIGRVFWAGPIYELVEAEPDLRVLEERDLIRRRGGSSMSGEREYAIKHALTREVAYGSLPKAQRARLHASFAEWLERLGDRDELAAFLAHHYAEAVRPEDVDLAWGGEDAERDRIREKAAIWLERAAELALGRLDIEDALALLQRALSLEPDEEGQARVWRMIGKAHALKFDGDAFLDAMERSLKVCSSPTICAETYGELAFQASLRGGMWRKRPEAEVVDGWVDRALESSGAESVTRVKALVARCIWMRKGMAVVADEAIELAERLGNRELVVYAWGGRAMASFSEGDFETALSWAQRRLDALDEISDPDHVADIYELAISAHCAAGSLDEARRLAIAHEAVVEPLTDHHRLHGIAVQLEVDETQGDWEHALELADETEARVEANLATPCVRNARSLLLLALAAAYLGDDTAARRYERRASEITPEGYDYMLAAPRTRLALLRGELDDVDALVWPADLAAGQTWFVLQSVAARLDVLAAAREREKLEREAPPFLELEHSYLTPFALRALGLVREDQTLIEQAHSAFESMGLAWHAEETSRLVAQA